MKKLHYYLLAATIICSVAQTNAQVKKAPDYKKMGCATVEPTTTTFAFDTTKPRQLADNYYLWDNGKTLVVRIMNGGNSKYKAMVMRYAKEWEKYANIKFQFVEVGNSHIRVILTGNDGGGNYSRLGTQALNVSQDEHTLHLDTTSFVTPEYTYTAIVHEFGHAIGLMHEHMNPTSGIQWDKNRVYAAYKLLQGWDKDMVDAQLFKKYNVSYTNGSKYDSKSIMHYPISRWETLNGYSVDWNYSISQGDKDIVALLYPKKGERSREVPRFTVTDFAKMDVENSTAKQGVSFYPSFTINTAGKEGRVYYLAIFTDDKGNMFETKSENYKVFGAAGTSKTTVLAPGQKLAFNQGKHDMELFIPTSEIPENIRNKNVKAMFYVFLYDNDELKIVYSSSAVNCNMAR